MGNFLKSLTDSFTKSNPEGSESGKLDSKDMGNTFRYVLLATLAAFLTFSLESVADLGLEGNYQMIAIAALTIGLDFVNKLLKNNKKDKDTTPEKVE